MSSYRSRKVDIYLTNEESRAMASSKTAGAGQLCQPPSDINNGRGEAMVTSEVRRQWFQSWQWCDKDNNSSSGSSGDCK